MLSQAGLHSANWLQQRNWREFAWRELDLPPLAAEDGAGGQPQHHGPRTPHHTPQHQCPCPPPKPCRPDQKQQLPHHHSRLPKGAPSQRIAPLGHPARGTSLYRYTSNDIIRESPCRPSKKTLL